MRVPALVCGVLLLAACPSPELTSIIVQTPDATGPKLEVSPAAPCAFGTKGPQVLTISVTNLSAQWEVDRAWKLLRYGEPVRRFVPSELADRLTSQVVLAGAELPPLVAGDYVVQVKVKGPAGEQTLEAKVSLLQCVFY